jgi:hypothetical protein
VANLVLLASLVIRSGFFSLEGGVIIAIPATLFVWIIAMSVLMMRADRRTVRPANAATGRPRAQ